MFERKIATCCYCSRRTLLRNTANDGHELACASCGAPLHVMKPLRPEAARAAASHGPAPVGGRSRKAPKVVGNNNKKKKRRPLWQKLASEIWDEIEDIFD